MVWAKNGTPDTATGATDTVTISDMTSTTFNMFMSVITIDSGNTGVDIRVGNGSIDTGSNYTRRFSANGAADGTTVNTNLFRQTNNAWGSHFVIGYFINISSEEKLMMAWAVEADNTGAADDPDRNENVAKWVNTSNQIDQIQTLNQGTGDFGTDTNISALGTD